MFLVFGGASCQQKSVLSPNGKEIEAILLDAGKELGWGGEKIEYSKLGHFIRLTNKGSSLEAKIQIRDISSFLRESNKEDYLKRLCAILKNSGYQSRIEKILETQVCHIKKSYREDFIFDNTANAVIGNYHLMAQSSHDHGEALDARELIVPLIKNAKGRLTN